MFNNNNSQRTEDGTSLIGEGLNVEGDLNCKGSIEVAGIMNGNIIANGLKVLETGSIIGGVKAGRFEVFPAAASGCDLRFFFAVSLEFFVWI